MITLYFTPPSSPILPDATLPLMTLHPLSTINTITECLINRLLCHCIKSITTLYPLPRFVTAARVLMSDCNYCKHQQGNTNKQPESNRVKRSSTSSLNDLECLLFPALLHPCMRLGERLAQEGNIIIPLQLLV